MRRQQDRLALREQLAPDGSWMIVEPAAGDAVEDNLAQVLAYDLDRHTPFKPEEVCFDARVVGRDAAKKELRVDWAAARKSVVEQARRRAESWGALVLAVTPDALGDRWQDGKLHGAVKVDLNDAPFGRADAGVDMTFDFGTLIAHLAKTRALCAGTIVGSGTVSNRDADGGPGKPIMKGGLGYSCIAEVRTVETILNGAPETPFLKKGDTVRIWMDDARHHPIFGTIDQTVV